MSSVGVDAILVKCNACSGISITLNSCPRCDNRSLNSSIPKSLVLVERPTVQKTLEDLGLEVINVDLLINNAGVPDGRWRNISEIDDEWVLQVLDINSVGPVRMVRELYNKMNHESLTTVAMISSLMGSIDDCHSGRSYAYRASKTALNMFSVAMKKESLEHNISFLILHPGWVKTRMGGEHAPVELTESVDGMLNLIDNHTLEDSGRFVQYDGVDLPW